jgi:hypothetical protein
VTAAGCRTRTSRKKSALSAGARPPGDLRIIESFMAQIGGGGKKSDALEAAQEIMWDAWDLSDRRRRVALAKKALEVSPLCADACVMMKRLRNRGFLSNSVGSEISRIDEGRRRKVRATAS